MRACRGMGAVNPAKYAKGGKVKKYAEGTYVDSGVPDENGVTIRYSPETEPKKPAPKAEPKKEPPKKSMFDRMRGLLAGEDTEGAVKKATIQRTSYAKGGSTFGTPFDGKSPFKSKHAPFGSGKAAKKANPFKGAK